MIDRPQGCIVGTPIGFVVLSQSRSRRALPPISSPTSQIISLRFQRSQLAGTEYSERGILRKNAPRFEVSGPRYFVTGLQPPERTRRLSTRAIAVLEAQINDSRIYKFDRRLLLHGDLPRAGNPHVQRRPWCFGGRHVALRRRSCRARGRHHPTPPKRLLRAASGQRRQSDGAARRLASRR